jgi:acyl carrier protein
MDQFKQLFAEALEKEPSEVAMDDEFRKYEEWDSLAVLSIIAMIKQNYDITIPRKEFDELKIVSDLFEYIQAHRKK